MSLDVFDRSDEYRIFKISLLVKLYSKLHADIWNNT